MACIQKVFNYKENYFGDERDNWTLVPYKEHEKILGIQFIKGYKGRELYIGVVDDDGFTYVFSQIKQNGKLLSYFRMPYGRNLEKDIYKIRAYITNEKKTLEDMVDFAETMQ